jgi:hypothetical protein
MGCIFIKCRCKWARKANLQNSVFLLNAARAQIGDEALNFCHAGVANRGAIA